MSSIDQNDFSFGWKISEIDPATMPNVTSIPCLVGVQSSTRPPINRNSPVTNANINSALQSQSNPFNEQSIWTAHDYFLANLHSGRVR